MSQRWQRDGYFISTDRELIDVAAVHQFLTNSYWATGIPIEIVKRSIEHSLCFGIYKDSEQVGFARVITDRATFAYLADVFVVERYRQQGLSKWLMEVIVSHPELQGLRGWMLVTRDAHELYRKYGFKNVDNPARLMMRHNPDVYVQANKS